MSAGVDASGNGVVVWVGNDGANFRISYATYTVSTDTWFIAPSFISTSGVNASNPFISKPGWKCCDGLAATIFSSHSPSIHTEFCVRCLDQSDLLSKLFLNQLTMRYFQL